MCVIKLVMTGLLASQLCFVSISYADSDIENVDLARIYSVLNSLAPLINEAESQQDKNDRVLFRYDWLRSDIESIKQGINQKLKPLSIQPRSIAPLKGDYLTQQGKH